MGPIAGSDSYNVCPPGIAWLCGHMQGSSRLERSGFDANSTQDAHLYSPLPAGVSFPVEDELELASAAQFFLQLQEVALPGAEAGQDHDLSISRIGRVWLYSSVERREGARQGSEPKKAGVAINRQGRTRVRSLQYFHALAVYRYTKCGIYSRLYTVPRTFSTAVFQI